MIRCGGANLNLSTGGFAYGMPRYSTTHGELSARCPVMGPLDVLTVVYRDALHFGAAETRLAQKAIADINLTIVSEYWARVRETGQQL